MTFDVRCASCSGQAIRCQLYAGHEGEHAVLVAAPKGRVLLLWDRSGAGRQEPFSSDVPRQFAWAPEFPQLVTAPPEPTDPAPRRPRLYRVA